MSAVRDTEAASDSDALFGISCGHAAGALKLVAREIGISKIGEKRHLQPALRHSVGIEFGDSRVLPHEPALLMPGWDAGGRLGGVDLVVTSPANTDFQYLAELKGLSRLKGPGG